MGNLAIFYNDRPSAFPSALKAGATYTCPNCSGTSGTATITTSDNFNTRGVFVNDPVSGHANIPAGAFVVSINSNTSITISANLLGNISGITVTFTALKHEDPAYPITNLTSPDRGKVWRVLTALPDPYRIDFDFGIAGAKVHAHGWTACDGWDGDVNFDVKYITSGAWPQPNSSWVSISEGVGDHIEVEATSEGGNGLTGRRDQIQADASYNGATGRTARLWRFEFGSHVGAGNSQSTPGAIKFHLWGDMLDLGIESGPGAVREWIEPRSELVGASGVRSDYLLGRGWMRFLIPFPSVDHALAMTNLQKKLLRYSEHPILALKDFDAKAYEFNLRNVAVTRNFGTSGSSGVYDTALEFESYP